MDPCQTRRPPSPRPPNPQGRSWVLPVVAFCALGLILLLHHEIWQDEWQAWLIAKDSPSLPALFRNFRHEGHPGLWYFGLFLVSRLTPSPLGMQVLHLLVATGAVYLFLTYAPFSRLEKLLFIFGYFPFYEYAVISRNYGVGELCLFSFCAIFCMPGPRNYLFLSVILFLLSQTNVYGLMIGIVLGVILIGTAIRDQSASTFTSVAATIIVLSGIGLSLAQIVPPAHTGGTLHWRFELDVRSLGGTLATVWKAYFPIPALDYHFWNSNIVPTIWQVPLSLILLVFGLLLFIRQPAPLFLYTVGSLGILAFGYLQYSGSLRHHGHLFLVFVASLWLSSVYPQKRIFLSFIQPLSDFCRANRDRVVLVLFSAHLLAGLAAGSMDLLFPFCASQDTANFIKHELLNPPLIMGHSAPKASAVAGYLGRQIYYPSSRRWGSFVTWDRDREVLQPERLLAQAAELSSYYQQNTLLVLNYELPPDKYSTFFIKKFTNSMLKGDMYYLYLVPVPDQKSLKGSHSRSQSFDQLCGAARLMKRGN